jgi:3-oxoacyl-[acyl-carrier protein] reductase
LGGVPESEKTSETIYAKGAKVVITGEMKKTKKVADEIGAIPLSFDISDLKSIPQKAKRHWLY